MEVGQKCCSEVESEGSAFVPLPIQTRASGIFTTVVTRNTVYRNAGKGSKKGYGFGINL